MVRIISLIMALFTVLAVNAETFSYKINSHALMKITVTYTLGFGKKVSLANELQISGSAASGILK